MSLSRIVATLTSWLLLVGTSDQRAAAATDPDRPDPATTATTATEAPRAPQLLFYTLTGHPLPHPAAIHLATLATHPDTAAGREALARELVAALVTGPPDDLAREGVRGPLPTTTAIDRIAIEGSTVTLYLTTGSDFLESLDDARLEQVTEAVTSTLSYIAELRRFSVVARSTPGAPYRHLHEYLPRPPPLPRKSELQPRATAAPSRAAAGALSGKTVFLSAGHGWYWHAGLTDWITQRGNTNALVEDLHTAETVNQFLVQYLEGMGADVWTMRERGMLEAEVIVDDAGPNPAGTYTETGAWIDSTLTGFAAGRATYTTENPFSIGGNRLVGDAAAAGPASARWSFDVVRSGLYPVYVSYSEFTSRPSDAHYVVRHAGGDTHLRVDQRVHGFTWRYLGTFYFAAGSPPERASVEVHNDVTAGTFVSADAARLGGGLGNIDRGAGASVRPRFEEAARYWAQYQGAPASVYDPCATGEDNCDDVTARPRYAEYERAPGEDAVYVALHTNAGGGTGTDTFIHDTAPTPGSAELQGAIHAELINDIQNGWDAGWVDRMRKSADFGEVRALSTMPGVLIELAFHDNPAPGDSDDLKEADFRQLAARAIAQGIARYFDPTATLPPEPPVRIAVTVTGPSAARVTWRPAPRDTLGIVGDPPTGYTVYLSDDGHGFEGGTATTATSLDLTGLDPSRVHYVRVTASNAGGESLPSEVLAVRTAASGSALLLVNGFDRIDAAALIPQLESAALGTILRMFLWRMNSRDYTIAHASAVDDAGAAIGIASAANEAVAMGDLALDDYCAVLWILGEESTADETFSAAEQAAVSAYLDGGGQFLASGAEIGWDLVARGAPADADFYRDRLKAVYRADDAYPATAAPANRVAGVAGGPFDGLSGIRFDGAAAAIYDVDYPDAIDPDSGATLELRYESPTGAFDGAAVAFAGDHRVLTLSFPFESIIDPADRADLMARVLDFFGLTPVTARIADLEGVRSGTDVVLRWGRLAEATGYVVYRSGAPAGPFDATSDVTALDGDGSPADGRYLDLGAATGTAGSIGYYQAAGENCAGSGPL